MNQRGVEYAEIVGGPRDGEVVPFVGPQMFEPVRRPMGYVPGDHLPGPSSLGYELLRYQAYQWRDSRDSGYIGWRYVLGEHAEGLGCR